MRPVASEQNLLRFPLNVLLGTQAHVRLLRVLADEVIGPINAADAAERAGLTEAGARRALIRLAKTGFVRRVGGGRSQQFALREADPLVGGLVGLFQAESDRFQELLSSLREILQEIVEIHVAWLDALPVHLGEPLHIFVIGDSKSLIWLGKEIRSRIEYVEQAFDLTIEVHRFSRADAPEVAWDEVMLLAGSPIIAPSTQRSGSADPADRELRLLRLSQAIARLLDRNPSLVRRALKHIDLLLEQDQGSATDDLREWQSVLCKYTIERLIEFLISSTSRAQRLRRSSPFFAVLTPEERDKVMQYLEATHDPRSA